MGKRTVVAPNEVNAEKGEGYCFSVGPGDELFFPHVDSCLAIAFALESNWVIGGHVPEEWSGIWDKTLCFAKMTSLMKATCENNLRLKVKGLIGVGPSSWNRLFWECYSQCNPEYESSFPALRIDTALAESGVNVKITPSVGHVAVNVQKIVVDKVDKKVSRMGEDKNFLLTGRLAEESWP